MSRSENFADDSVLQFTLREMQALIGKPGFWLVLAVIDLVATISGPFSTLEDFTLARRFAYWTSIIILTALAAAATSTFFAYWLQRRGAGFFVQLGASSIAASVPVTLIVWFITAFIAGNTNTGLTGLLQFTTKTVPIAVVVAFAFQLMARSNQDASDGAHNSSNTEQNDAAFLKRLSVGLGKDIYALQAQDHYVQATTARGQEMILVRFEDAIRELEGVQGLRVHRSWWVADIAVAKLFRAEGKTSLILRGDMVVPVSRSYQSDVRERFSHL